MFITPLSLYIHIPWCVRKCPYCDFNSHALKGTLPEEAYVAALLQEIDDQQHLIQNRSLVSLFFGGGTPSLFSPQAIAQIIDGVAKRMVFAADIEITLEANPGTIDQHHFLGFKQAGINRLSLGVQSFQNEKLMQLGRIHDQAQAQQAIELAQKAGFNNFNIDIMYGLPNQSLDDLLHDIRTALSLNPSHFSWYQLTIEPNTLFHRHPPTLPADDMIWDMQLAGQAFLQAAGFNQYEVSAYSLPNQQCVHNRNYWEFGDYLGIGAGAHSKITLGESGKVVRFAQVKHPNDYLDPAKRRVYHPKEISDEDLVFEFMLNALRLTHGVPKTLFTERTGLSLDFIQQELTQAKKRGLLINDANIICPTDMGKRYLNNLLMLFLDKEKKSL